MSKTLLGATRAAAALVALGTAFGWGCELPFASVNSDQLLSAAVEQAVRAPTIALKGEFTGGDRTNHSFELHYKAGDAEGCLDCGDATRLRVLYLHSDAYLNGKEFLASRDAAAAGVIGVGWWTGPPDRTVPGLTQLLDRPALLKSLAAGRTGFSVSQAQVVGQSANRLSDQQVSFYIGASTPHRLLRIETSAGRVFDTGLRDLAFDLYDYGRTVSLDAQPQAVRLDDPSTWPPHFKLVKVLLEQKCNVAIGCPLAASLTNEGGVQAPAATGRFFLRRTDGTEFAGCAVDIPTVEHGATSVVRCSVISQGLIDLINGIGTGSTPGDFYYGFDIQNPP